MPLYESVFIARQDISASQVDGLADNFENIVKEAGGSVERREYWGLRNLAYRIKKNRKGHYVLFNFDAPSEAIQEMERNMQLNEDVLRYLTIRIEKLRAEPSPIMQGKGDRERERADRRSRDEPRPEKPSQEAAPEKSEPAPEKAEEPAGETETTAGETEATAKAETTEEETA
jgi:small subunit ribosomal protein S6